jgi:hypothetical protein
MSRAVETRVLIVGAAPVGRTLALGSARYSPVRCACNRT